MPTRDELAEAMRDAAAEVLGEVPEGYSEASRLEEDLGVDSLDMLEIVMVLEDRFDFTRDEGVFADVETVGQALDVLADIVS
jgi:acyl carrier protein